MERMFLILHLKQRSSTGRLPFTAWAKQQIVQTSNVNLSFEQRAGLKQLVSRDRIKIIHTQLSPRNHHSEVQTTRYSLDQFDLF